MKVQVQQKDKLIEKL
jgi:uncharacterized protein YoxC